MLGQAGPRGAKVNKPVAKAMLCCSVLLLCAVPWQVANLPGSRGSAAGRTRGFSKPAPRAASTAQASLDETTVGEERHVSVLE